MTLRRLRSLLFGFMLLLAPRTSPGQQSTAAARLESSPRHHEWVEIKADGGRKVRALLVFPEIDKPAPGVLVIHENRGLNEWARSVADQFAEAGYVALAPDLLSQTGPGGGGTDSYKNPDDAREGIYKLPADQVMKDLAACAAFLRKHEAVNGRVATAGFCWGGGQSFRFAAHSPDLDAALVFYGPAPGADELTKIHAPVFGFYGGNDFRITGQVGKTQTAMKELGKKYEPVTYKGAGHGFLRSGEEAGASAADRDGRAEAWKRIKAILKKLEGPASRPAH